MRQKLEFVADNGNTFEEIIARWFQGQLKLPKEAKITRALRLAIQKSLLTEQNIRRYSYRPFVTNYVFFDPVVLKLLSSGGEGGGGTRFRPEICAAFSAPSTFGISVTPAPEDVGEALHRFVSFCWDLPDNDLAKRGNGRVCCNEFPYYKTDRGAWDSKPRCNVHPRLLRHATLVPGCGNAADAIVFYCYAILCSNSYRDAFEGRLKAGMHEEWPRIPISSDPEMFLFLAEDGKRLALLEHPGEPVALSQSIQNALDQFTTSFYLARGEIDEERQLIRLFADGEDYRPRIEIANIPDGVLQLRVSGYPPIQQWLKIHTRTYARTEFTKEDMRSLCALLERISRQIDILERVNDTVQGLIDAPSDLLPFQNTPSPPQF